MATTGTFNGRLMNIYFAGTAIAKSTDFTVSITQDEIDVTAKDSDGYKDILPGLGSWSASGTGYVDLSSSANYSYLFSLYTSKTRVMVKFSTNTSGDKYYHSYAYLTSLELTAPNEGPVGYSFSIAGDSKLTESPKT